MLARRRRLARPSPAKNHDWVVWNARGLGGQRSFQNLSRLVHEMNPDFCFISDLEFMRMLLFLLKLNLVLLMSFVLTPLGVKKVSSFFGMKSLIFLSCPTLLVILITSFILFRLPCFYGSPKHNEHIFFLESP